MRTVSSCLNAAPARRRVAGFTLIELVVAMVVAAILAAIAIPAYSSYVRKSRRVEAKNALLDVQTLEERFYSTQNTYTTDFSQLGYGASAASSVTVGNGYYTMSVPVRTTTAVAPTATTAGTPEVVSITAAALGDQLKDTTCRSFTVTTDGKQGASDATGVDSTSTCWK